MSQGQHRKRKVGDLDSGSDPIIFNNPIQASSWNLSETALNVRVPRDAQGNIWAIPSFLINPSTNPIVAQSAVRIMDGTNAALLANLISDPAVTNLNGVFAGLGQQNLQLEVPLPMYLSQGQGWEFQEEATAFAHAFSTGASSTSVLATGGAGKKYRLMEAYGSYATTAAVAADSTTLNEVTSGAVIAGFVAGAAGGYAFDFHFGQNGVFQPNANNAIQITTVAASTLDLTLVYAVAR